MTKTEHKKKSKNKKLIDSVDKALMQIAYELHKPTYKKIRGSSVDWIKEVTDAFSDNEAPGKFFEWAAIVSISAIVRKNVYLDRFFYHLYPNVFVFLIAQSGMKKGIPIDLAKKLVTKTNATRVISGRNSMPKIIQDLGRLHTFDTGATLKDAHALLVSGELAAFLVKDPDALTVLTDLHNTHENEEFWINSLKSSDKDKLKSPCLTLFGATNEDLLGDVIANKDVAGGFVARTFMVLSQDRGKLNSLTERPAKIADTDLLLQHLKAIMNLTGEFQWGLDSKAFYDKWYYELMGRNVSDPTGTINRIGDKALKIAMIVSLSQRLDLVMTKDHIHTGIAYAMDCYNSAKQVTMGSGKATLSSQTRMILRDLIKDPNHSISRKTFLQNYWGELDAFDIDRIAETLVGADAIDIQYPGKGNCVYVLKQEALDRYTKFDRGII